MLEKLQVLLGPEALSQYQDYTKHLLGNITAEQFKDQLIGEKEEKETKARQVGQIMLEATQQVLASAGLPADYQIVPTLNFRNIASETEAEKNLKLIDDVYARAIAKAGSFLSPEEIEKFGEFRKSVNSGNRVALTMNRKMMSPEAK